MLPSDKEPVVPKTKNGIMEAYSDMSKQYLKLITMWCLSIFCMNIFYIAFSFFKFDDATNAGTRASCIVIGVFLHYFLIMSFCFSFTISVVQYIILCRSFKIYKYILLKAIIFSTSKLLKCCLLIL
jgi:hypothetical protein